jgi:hypothetical protein
MDEDYFKQLDISETKLTIISLTGQTTRVVGLNRLAVGKSYIKYDLYRVE